MLSKMSHTIELRLNLPPFLENVRFPSEQVLGMEIRHNLIETGSSKRNQSRTFLLLIITPVDLRSTLRGGERARTPCAPARDEVPCAPGYEWISNIFDTAGEPFAVTARRCAARVPGGRWLAGQPVGRLASHLLPNPVRSAAGAEQSKQRGSQRNHFA